MNEKEAQEKFDKQYLEYEQLSNTIYDCNHRTREAQNKIAQLNEEKEKLRVLRPKYLADKKDITKLNSKLKNIDEEIEIQKDLISGLEEKIKPLKQNIVFCGTNTNACYQDLVQAKMDKVAKEFNKLAKPLAKITKEYIVLEYIKNSERNRWASFAEHFGFIPNIGAEKPFLKDSAYQIYINNREEITEKNNLPKYEYYRKPTLY